MEYLRENGALYQVENTKKSIIKKFIHEFHTKLTTDKTNILADGTDTATITAEVYNYLDEAQTTWTDDIIFELDGVEQVVATTNGQASITFSSADVGDFTITTDVPNFRNGEVVIHAG